MNQAIYTGNTGLLSQQRRIEIIANNVANVNTYGYKASRLDFKDALYATLLRPIQPQDDLNLRRGHGGIPSETPRQFTQGATFITTQPTDLLISGEGYLTVESNTGEPVFTRNGALAVSADAEGRLSLVTQGGQFVLDENGQHIQFPEGSSVENLVVNTDGSMQIGLEAPFAKLTLVNFANPNALSAAGNTAFAETEASGAPTPIETSTIRQFALEGSTVDLGLEMTRMIRTQRALQLAARAVTAADNMEMQANTLRN